MRTCCKWVITIIIFGYSERPPPPKKNLNILNGPPRCCLNRKVSRTTYSSWNCLIPLPVPNQQDEYAYKSSRPEETKQDSKVGVEMPIISLLVKPLYIETIWYLNFELYSCYGPNTNVHRGNSNLVTLPCWCHFSSSVCISFKTNITKFCFWTDF